MRKLSTFDLIMYSLIATNVAVYSMLTFGYLRSRFFKIPKVSDYSIAFGILEDALTRSFSDLPLGFTWEEGIARAKRLKLGIQWNEVEGALRNYEKYRYGKEGSMNGDTQEVLKLAYSLPRKPAYDHRSKK